MDLILICRDSDASSVVTNALLAVQARKAGRSAGLLFSGDALLTLRQGSFLWSRRFWPQRIRWGVADRASALGIPVRGKGQWRELDVAAILERARTEGVQFLACPVWMPLLEREISWPEGLEMLGVDQALLLLDETKTVVGSF
jgi:hypothetical protein